MAESYLEPSLTFTEIIVVQDYVYEYNYQDPATYYDVGEGDGGGNVTTPGPVNKYVSVWQHDDASW